MVEKLSLEDQLKLPIVMELLEENERITVSLSTKLPDSKIENLTVPHTFKDKLLMAPGTHNEITYSKEAIMAKVNIADGVQLFLDHKDTSGEGAQNWIGTIANPVYKLGDQGEGMYGDLVIVDKVSAQKLAGGAKLGVSPTIDFDRTDFGCTTCASDLMWKSFSLVSSPAIRATMLNSKQKKTGELNMEPTKPKTFPYKVELSKDNTPQTETIELSDEKAVELLTKRDTDIKELQKVKKELTEKLEKFETAQKTELTADLAANEFLVGRVEPSELEDRMKSLMEKSPEILQEVGAVIGDHANLQEFKQFIKTYQVENKDKSIKDAALAYTEQANKPEPAKLGVEPTAPAVPAKVPDATAQLAAASLVGAPQDPQKQTAELSSGQATDADKDMFKTMHAQMFPGVPQ